MATSHIGRRPRRCGALQVAALVALVICTGVAQAQTPDSTSRPDTLRGAGDSIPELQRLGVPAVGSKPPISGSRAFLYSFLVPGLGQARLDRPNAGALFATIEMGAILMAYKSAADLRYAEDAARGTRATGFVLDTIVVNGDSVALFVPTDSLSNRYASRLKARRVHYEDWIAVLLFNHIFAGADAFVAANLWDMPVRGSLRAVGPRAAMVGATVEFGGRRRR